MEAIAILAQWAATLGIAGGLIYTIRKNGKARDEKDTQLKTELKSEIEHINKKLDDPTDGLKAIRSVVEEQRVYCAKTSSGLTERVIALEKKEVR